MVNEPSRPAQVQPSSHPFPAKVGSTGHGGSLGLCVFRIDEFTERSDTIEQIDQDGEWIPTTTKGQNIRVNGGVSGLWWYCDGHHIHQLSNWTPEPGSIPYKMVSTVYSDLDGFLIMKGDATNPQQGETWHRLGFDWNETTKSHSLSSAGTQHRLRFQDSLKRWPHMLLPEMYHGTHDSSQGHGGLTGDLGIFLSLIALSMKPDRLWSELPTMMFEGRLREHTHQHGRTYGKNICKCMVSEANQS